MELKWRVIEENLFKVVTAIAAIITSLLLVLIIGKIAIEALPALTMYYIFTPESKTSGIGQGIFNALIGTIYLSVLAVIISTPLSVGTAIYLKKYAKDSLFTKVLRFFIDVLSGTPAIVLGIFGFFIFVYLMRSITGGFSLLSGSMALAILILPVIERATEEAINTVPLGIEEGSYALGATKWDTIKKIVIPYSLSGIITGMVLGIGRAAEESAVVILTAGYTQFLPNHQIIPNEKFLLGFKIYPLQDTVASLPITVYHAYEFSGQVPIANGFASALVLIFIVMIINALARVLLWRFKIGKA